MKEAFGPFFALCIGTEDGTSDAVEVYKRLVYNFPFNNICLLVNKNLESQAIIEKIDELAGFVSDDEVRKKNPLLFIFYAGHGAIEDDNKIYMDLRAKSERATNTKKRKMSQMIDIDKILTADSNDLKNLNRCLNPSEKSEGEVTVFFCFEMCYAGQKNIGKSSNRNLAVIFPNRGETPTGLIQKSLLQAWTYDPEIDTEPTIVLGELVKNVDELYKKNDKSGINRGYVNAQLRIPKLAAEQQMPKPSGIGDWSHVWRVPEPEHFIKYKAYQKILDALNPNKNEYQNLSGKVLIICGEGPVGKSTAVQKALKENNMEDHAIWVNCVPHMGVQSIVASIMHGLAALPKQTVDTSDYIHEFFKNHRNAINKYPSQESRNFLSDLVEQSCYPPKNPIVIFEDVDHLQSSPELDFVRDFILQYCKSDCLSRIVLIQQDTNDPCIAIPAEEFNVIPITPLAKSEIRTFVGDENDPVLEIGNYDKYGPQKPVTLNMIRWLLDRESTDGSIDQRLDNLVKSKLNDNLTLATTVAHVYKNILNDNEKKLARHIATLSSITDVQTGKPLLAGPVPIDLLYKDNAQTDVDSSCTELFKKALITINEDEKILFMHHSIAQRIKDEIEQSRILKDEETNWHSNAANYYREMLENGKRQLCVLYRFKVHSVAAGNLKDLTELLSKRAILEAIVAFGYFEIIEKWAQELLSTTNKVMDRVNLKICLRMAAMFNGDQDSYKKLIKNNNEHSSNNPSERSQDLLTKAEYALLLNDYREALRTLSCVEEETRRGRLFEDFATRVWLGFGYPMQALDLIKKHEEENPETENNYWRYYLKGSCYAQLFDFQNAMESYKSFLRNFLPKNSYDYDAMMRTLIIGSQLFAENVRFNSLVNADQAADHEDKLTRALTICCYAHKLLEFRPVEDYYWKSKYYLALAQVRFELQKIHNFNSVEETLQKITPEALKFPIESLIFEGIANLHLKKDPSKDIKKFLTQQGRIAYIEQKFSKLISRVKIIYDIDKWNSDPFKHIKELIENYIPEYNETIWSVEEKEIAIYPFLETDLMLLLARYYVDSPKKEDNDLAMKVIFIALTLANAWNYQRGIGFAEEIAAVYIKCNFDDLKNRIKDILWYLKYFVEASLVCAVRADSMNLIFLRSKLYLEVASKFQNEKEKKAEFIDSKKAEEFEFIEAEIIDAVDNAISHGLSHKYLTGSEAESMFRDIEKRGKEAGWEKKIRSGKDLAKRRNVRTPVYADVVVSNMVKNENCKFTGCVIDLSYSGCAIKCNKAVQQDSHANINTIDKIDGHALSFEGIVTRNWTGALSGSASFYDGDNFKDTRGYSEGFAVRFTSEITRYDKELLEKKFDLERIPESYFYKGDQLDTSAIKIKKALQLDFIPSAEQINSFLIKILKYEKEISSEEARNMASLEVFGKKAPIILGDNTADIQFDQLIQMLMKTKK